jgi:sec-independent protein translocase protein TatA
MPFGMGFGELVLILVIVMVVFGATKLPQLGDGLGRAIKNFKRSVSSTNEIDVTPKASSQVASTGTGTGTATGTASGTSTDDETGQKPGEPATSAPRDPKTKAPT